MFSLKISDWLPARKNTLRGFFAVTLPNGLVIRDFSVHEKGGRWWLSPPGRPRLQDGRVVIDDSGKPQYSPVVGFVDAEARRRLEAEILDALRAAHPEAF